MVDFGSARVRTIAELFTKYFRPGDIYTHAYAGGGRGELIDGRVNPAIFAAQKKGIFLRSTTRRLAHDSSALRDQLLDRRRTVELEIARVGRTPDLARLLRDVDDAFVRLENGSFGTCESCHEPIEAGCAHTERRRERFLTRMACRQG